jgi:hypothetical protein
MYSTTAQERHLTTQFAEVQGSRVEGISEYAQFIQFRLCHSTCSMYTVGTENIRCKMHICNLYILCDTVNAVKLTSLTDKPQN